MNTEATQTPLFSRQPRSILGWLIANRLKRGALLYWAALFTLSAAVMHFIGVLEQPPQSGFLAVLLFGGAVVQVAVGLAVVAVPARRLLIAATVVEGAAVLLWIVARTSGFPLGSTLWRPETLSIQDFYLPLMEGVSAFFFLCLAARTWTIASRAWRIALDLLPSFLVLSLLAWGVVSAMVNFYPTEDVIVSFFLTAGLPTSFQVLFLPAVGLLAALLLLRFVFPRFRTMTPRAWRTALALLPALLLVSLLTWAGGSAAATRGWFPVSSTVKAPAGQTTTLVYCSPGGNPLAMDLSEPSAKSPRPAPLVFYVHGGGGYLNGRVLAADSDGVYWMRLRDELLGHGFVVASIDYPLLPLSLVQDMVKDAKCAVRFLRAHASELLIDPQRIGVYGESEGGYLAAMLGTAGPDAGFDVGQYLDQSSRVQAVADLWGISDLMNMSGSPSWMQSIGPNEFGISSPAALRSAFPDHAWNRR